MFENEYFSAIWQSMLARTHTHSAQSTHRWKPFYLLLTPPNAHHPPFADIGRKYKFYGIPAPRAHYGQMIVAPDGIDVDEAPLHTATSEPE